MQGVNVFENGIGFLMKCLGLYTSGTGFFVLYLLSVIIIVLCGSKRERDLFVPQAVLLLITVFNPLFPIILDRIFDVNSEYYRFFWIVPAIILVPYMGAKIIGASVPHKTRPVAVLLVAAMFILGGNFVYASDARIAGNIYKIDDELIQIADMIHADSDSTYTRAFFEYEYNMEIRQYDPKMLLCIDREDYLYAVNYSFTDEMLHDESKPQYRLLAPLVRNQNVNKDDFCLALEQTGTRYLVLMKDHPQERFIKDAGLYEIGQSAGHVIYRYDLNEPADYELVDYTDAPHRFSFRRLK